MKTFIMIVLFVTVAVFSFAVDPAEGFWISTDEESGKDTAGWEIYIQNDKLYGRILSIAGIPQTMQAINCKDNYKDFPIPGKVNEMTIVGTPWIFGLVPGRQPGEWRRGNIIDPVQGELYGCTITFRPAGSRSGSRTFQSDTLEMRGAIGPFGRSQFWRRVTQAQAAWL
jgi:uncharacterized protein (DUF2147 family)